MNVTFLLSVLLASAPLGDAVKDFIAGVERDNGEFVRTHGHDYFMRFVDGQHPRATVLTCGDSRFHVHAISHDSDNDLFVVRNIGNQLQTSVGSVEYGVRHLHTPVLLVIGHVGCGAVDAALGDYSHTSLDIQRELNGLHLTMSRTPHTAGAKRSTELVLGNVHSQVDAALQLFRAEVDRGELAVIGAVYDFRDELAHGEGRLLIIDVNGEKNQRSLERLLHERPSKPVAAPAQPAKEKP